MSGSDAFRAVGERLRQAVVDLKLEEGEEVAHAALLRLLRRTARKRLEAIDLGSEARDALVEEMAARGLPVDEGLSEHLGRALGADGRPRAAARAWYVGVRWTPIVSMAVLTTVVSALVIWGPGWSARQAPPARRITRSDALYFVLVDRFSDGRSDDPGTVDRGDPQGWHGGDLAGLIDHLDHLDRLGIGGVWISPVSVGRTEPIGEWGAYHGYWVTDLGEVGPRFGTMDDLVALSRGLHDRGMTLTLDLVLNHVGYDAALVQERPDWFHHRGDVVDWNDPVQLVTHDVHGLPDLAQENEEVYAWLRDRTSVLLDRVRPDGLRLDAVRHLPEGFVARLGDDLRARHPDLVLLGEVFDGDAEHVRARAQADKLDQVFDFPLYYGMVDALCGPAPIGRAAAGLTADLGAVPVTLIDNHDTPRISSLCGEDADQVAQVLAFQLTARGRPSITWGTEIGLVGREEPLNRADMDFGGAATHPLQVTIRSLLGLRSEWRELREGTTRPVWLSDDELVVARSLPESTVLVSTNRAAEPRPLRRPASFADGSPIRSLQLVRAGVPSVGSPTVPARGTRIERYERALSAPVSGARLRLEGGAPGQILVGSGARLGGWEPALGVVAGPDGAFELDVEDGQILTYKIVTRRADDSIDWGTQTDRYLLVSSVRTPDGCGPSCAPLVDGLARSRLP